jgi:hypothetical protein
VAALVAASLVDEPCAIVVPALPPSVDELPSVLAGGPPIAVVPVEGVVDDVLPGVAGPARALDVAPPGVPTLFVPAMLPVVGAAEDVPESGVLLPSVLEPSVCELGVVPQGVPSGAPGLVCANAAPAPRASATPASCCANLFMASLLEVDPSWRPARRARSSRQCAEALTRMPRICPASFDAGGRG